MSVKRLCVLSVLIFLHVQLSPKSFIVSRLSSSSVTTIDGKEFEHVKKYDNGLNTEQFLIKGVPVEKEQFYEQLHEARASAMHEEQQEIERKEQEKEAMHTQVQRALLEKLIVTSIDNMTQDLQILEKPVLRPYLLFDMASVRSAQDLQQISIWLKQISKNIKSLFAQSDVAALHKMADDLQARLESVRSCLKKSIEKATAQCDDTQVLKELLALVEA